jgi:hypothetical protein
MSPGRFASNESLALQRHSEPGPEGLGVGERMPHARAWCFQQNLFLDAVSGSIHGQSPSSKHVARRLRIIPIEEEEQP